MCDRMGINIWEVIDAAATKPFGFMPFYPGPGLGGHCIPIDPFYLSWKTRQSGIEARFIELAGYINGQMPHFVVEKVQNALNQSGKAVKGSRIHILGVAYKRDIEDVRESPALDIIHLLQRRGATVTFSDPYVPSIRIEGQTMMATDADSAVPESDCAVVITDLPQCGLCPHREPGASGDRHSQCTAWNEIGKNYPALKSRLRASRVNSYPCTPCPGANGLDLN